MLFYMNPECGIVAEPRKIGEWMKQSQTGLLSSLQKYLRHSRMRIAYECKCSNEHMFSGSGSEPEAVHCDERIGRIREKRGHSTELYPAADERSWAESAVCPEGRCDKQGQHLR